MRFGRLAAETVHHSVGHRRFWYCRCDCGNYAVVRQDQLTTEKTKSCGCILDESRIKNLSKGRVKKGRKDRKRRINGHNANWNPLKHEQPRLYRIWQSMKSRCYYEKNKCYSSYGGRGISVCVEWLHSFNAFADWALANGYEYHLSTFEKLPQWTREQIMKSSQYQKEHVKQTDVAVQPQSTATGGAPF